MAAGESKSPTRMRFRNCKKLSGTHRTSGTEQRREFDGKKYMKGVNPAKYQYTKDGNYGHTTAQHRSHLRRRTPSDLIVVFILFFVVLLLHRRRCVKAREYIG